MPSVLSGHTVDFGSSIGIYWGMQIDSFEILVYPTVMSNNLIISHKQEESDEQEHEATVEPCWTVLTKISTHSFGCRSTTAWMRSAWWPYRNGRTISQDLRMFYLWRPFGIRNSCYHLPAGSLPLNALVPEPKWHTFLASCKKSRRKALPRIPRMLAIPWPRLPTSHSVMLSATSGERCLCSSIFSLRRYMQPLTRRSTWSSSLPVACVTLSLAIQSPAGDPGRRCWTQKVRRHWTKLAASVKKILQQAGKRWPFCWVPKDSYWSVTCCYMLWVVFSRCS